jgi:hypothetical protein
MASKMLNIGGEVRRQRPEVSERMRDERKGNSPRSRGEVRKDRKKISHEGAEEAEFQEKRNHE